MVKKLFALLLTGALVVASPAATAHAQPVSAPTIHRIGSTDRYFTSIEVSRASYEQSAYAIIATGDNYADALVGSSLADAFNAPILLVPRDGITQAVLNELHRLNVQYVFVLGGAEVVSPAAESKLKQHWSVERIAGGNRYETALAIATKVMTFRPGKTVVLADGNNYPDALSASAFVAKNDCLMLLVNDNTLIPGSGPILSKAEKVYIIGGEEIVTKKLETAYNATRLAGEDRYATSLEVSKQQESRPATVIMVNGENFPDALSAVSLAKKHNAPILLKNPEPTEDETAYLDPVKTMYIIGGEEAMPETTVSDLVQSLVE